jgi:hypothetical protein
LKHDGGKYFHTYYSGKRKHAAAGKNVTDTPVTNEFIRDNKHKYNIE